MLCSKCYKKIPEGEEVRRGSNSVYWRAGWWAGEGGRSGTFCLRCAKIEDKREKIAWKAFTILFFGVVIFMILTWIAVFIVKKSV